MAMSLKIATSLKEAMSLKEATDFVNEQHSNSEWLQIIDELSQMKQCDDIAKIVLSSIPTTFPFPLKYFSVPEFRVTLFKYLNEERIVSFTKMLYGPAPFVGTFPDWILMNDGRINSVLYSEIFNTLLQHASERKLAGVYDVFAK